jgi:hydrogenase expression/formation protein HypC
VCLGIPGQIADVDPAHPHQCLVDIAGVRRAVDTSLLDDVRAGDWVVVHLGFALAKLDADEARAALAMLEVDGLVDGLGVDQPTR